MAEAAIKKDKKDKKSAKKEEPAATPTKEAA